MGKLLKGKCYPISMALLFIIGISCLFLILLHKHNHDSERATRLYMDVVETRPACHVGSIEVLCEFRNRYGNEVIVEVSRMPLGELLVDDVIVSRARYFRTDRLLIQCRGEHCKRVVSSHEDKRHKHRHVKHNKKLDR